MGNPETETLKLNLRGTLIQNEDLGYAEACKLYNGMIVKRPLMIARCTDVADVIAVVTFARDNGHLLAVRGGGHNGPGLGSCDGGVVIDLSPMKGVRIDPETCLVRVGPGCTQGDMDHATHAFGLAVLRGHRFYDRRRRPDVGRWIWLSDTQIRADDRQPRRG